MKSNLPFARYKTIGRDVQICLKLVNSNAGTFKSLNKISTSPKLVDKDAATSSVQHPLAYNNNIIGKLPAPAQEAFASKHSQHNKNHVRFVGYGNTPVLALNNNISQTEHKRTDTHTTMQHGPKHTQNVVICKVNKNCTELNSEQAKANEEGSNGEVPEIAGLQKKVLNHNSKDTLDESATIVDKVTKEIDSLVHLTHLQDPVDVVNGSSKSAGLDLYCSQLGSDYGIRNIPISVPTSPKQSSITGRKVYPSAETVLVSVAKDPYISIAAQSNKQVTFAGHILTLIIATPGHAMDRLKGDNMNTAWTLEQTSLNQLVQLMKFWDWTRDKSQNLLTPLTPQQPTKRAN